MTKTTVSSLHMPTGYARSEPETQAYRRAASQRCISAVHLSVDPSVASKPNTKKIRACQVHPIARSVDYIPRYFYNSLRDFKSSVPSFIPFRNDRPATEHANDYPRTELESQIHRSRFPAANPSAASKPNTKKIRACQVHPIARSVDYTPRHSCNSLPGFKSSVPSFIPFRNNRSANTTYQSSTHAPNRKREPNIEPLQNQHEKNQARQVHPTARSVDYTPRHSYNSLPGFKSSVPSFIPFRNNRPATTQANWLPTR